MRKALYFFIGLMIISFVGCSNDNEIKTPELKIACNEVDILVTKGVFKWTSTVGFFQIQSVVADAASPDQIASKIEAQTVLPQSKLILQFTKEPQEIEIVPWGELKGNSYSIDKNIITIPSEEGTYIYEIIGKWKEGEVSYTIKFNVKSN